jgi:hypothetical protein
MTTWKKSELSTSVELESRSSPNLSQAIVLSLSVRCTADTCATLHAWEAAALMNDEYRLPTVQGVVGVLKDRK